MVGKRAIAVLAAGTVGMALGTGSAGAAEGDFSHERQDTFTLSEGARVATCTVLSRFSYSDANDALGVQTFVLHSSDEACLDGSANHTVTFTTVGGEEMTVRGSGYNSTVLTSIEGVSPDGIHTEHYIFLNLCDCESPTYTLPK